MMMAPVRKRREVPRTVVGGVMGKARGAARRVEKLQGKKR
jgi:hypothetical protein